MFRTDAVGRGRTDPIADGRRATAVAQAVLAGAAPFGPHARPAIVNGAMGAVGAVVRIRGRLVGVVGMTVVGGRITAIDLIADREKLRALDVS